MSKSKINIIIGVTLLLISLCVDGYIYRDYVNIYLVNTEIDVDGFKLLMSGDKVGERLGEKYFSNSMFSPQTFRGKGGTLIDVTGIGKYRGKLISIHIREKSYSVLGIRVGDTLASAATKLEKRGFKINKKNKSYGKLDASRGIIDMRVYAYGYKNDWRISDIIIGVYPDVWDIIIHRRIE